MKNTNNTLNRVLGGALLALVFGVFIGAFPGTASAYYGGGYRYDYQDSYCPYPQIATIAANGYYTCSYPSAPAQPVYTPAPQPVYIPPALTASCYANNGSVALGTGVTWSATVNGGYGTYSYNWYGSDGLTGYNQNTYINYYTPGMKTASLVVTSQGQSITVNCGNSVNVYNYQQPIYQNTYVQPVPVFNNGPTILTTNVSGLDIGCYADPGNASPNQPVTWNVEVTGGAAPYRYSWSGSDGLTGESNTVIKYYQTSGQKSAIVTVTSADGRTGTKACSNAIAVRGYSSNVASTRTTSSATAVRDSSNSSLTGSALFSLNNIPWGWVAVLVILILFITVMYLIFNKPKM